MKAAKLYDFDDIRIEDIELPELGPRDALVKIRACGICSGDVMPWYIRRKAPLVLGHEPSGVIVKLGSDANNFREGDRVFIHHHAPCFECRHCMRGNFSMCQTWRKSQIVPGGIAEYVKVPELNLQHDTLKLPDNISFEDGTLIEPTACVVKGLKRARVGKDDIVLVIGLGMMGQMNIILAKYYGADLVIGADMVEYRLEKAKKFGADFVIDVSKENLQDAVGNYTNGSMADVVIVGPGSVEAMKSGIECAGKGSTVLFFTPTPEDDALEINPHHLYFNEISLVSSYSCGPTNTREAMGIIEKQIISADKLITHRFPVDRTLEGFRTTAAAKDSLKTIIVFD